MSPPQPTQWKRYDADFDPTADNAHTRVVQLVGRGKRVLELGCATGYMSRVLTDSYGCVVTGVEGNPATAEEARASCTRVIVGDLDTLNWDEALGAEQFDVVVAADVLEHLRNPAGVLAALRSYIAPGGHLVASIPNIAHASVIAELLQGRFTYQPFGLLDDSHLRFFTRDSIYECLEQAGYTVTYLDRVTLQPGDTEFRTVLASFPQPVAEWLASREESTTYQFVVTARPEASAPAGVMAGWPSRNGHSDASAYRSVVDRLSGQRGVEALDGVLQAHAARLAYLENTRAHQAETISALGETLAKHEDHIRAVTAESRRRHEELQNAESYATRLLGDIDALRGELDRAGDYAEHLKQALAASQRRLVHERVRMADALEGIQAPFIRELQAEHTRLARQLEEERVRGASQLAEERARGASQLAEERARAASQLADAADRIQSLEQAVAHLKSGVETYERSRSWRLTAPLRAAGRVLRGQRNPR